MTMYGKILVLMNFALSVMVMAWAIVFYTNRIDWDAALKPRQQRLKDAWTGIAAADPSWRDNRTDVLEQEGYRVADRPWYDAEIKHARSEATAMKPAREAVFNNGLIVLDPVDPKKPKHVRPRMRNATDFLNRPLENYEGYVKAEQKQALAVAAEQGKLRDLIDEDKRLTNLLVPEVGKGLRQRIEDEKVRIALVDEELAIIRPLLVNTAVESELILRRRQMLEARIKELNATIGVASKTD